MQNPADNSKKPAPVKVPAGISPNHQPLHFYLTGIMYVAAIIIPAASVQIFVVLDSNLFINDRIDWSLFPIPLVVILATGLLVGQILLLSNRLKQSSEKFRAVADVAKEFIYLRTIDGKYEYVSSSCTELCGYRQEDFYATPNFLDTLIHPDDLDRWKNHVHSVINFIAYEYFDVRLITKNNRIVWISHNCIPVFDESGLLPMIEQYKNEEEKDSKRYNELSHMLKACGHMAKIVRDFVSFSRESKGELNGLNINEVIDDTLGFSASRIKQKSIHLIKEYENRVPKVHGEKTELQQVILNIITNALDAVTDGGELRIKTGLTKDKNNVIMEFIDNGAGIEKEHLSKIFDPFHTTKRPGKGTGLGLSVSFRIIEKHGGNISAESEQGKGTKFTIYLPAVKPNNT